MIYNLSSLPTDYSNYKNCFILIHDNWDDWFTYRTKYILYYVNENLEDIMLGSLKIGMQDMEQTATVPLPKNFDHLPKTYFSVGQSEYYYESIKELGDQTRVYILEALRDMAFNLTIFKNVKNLDVTKISLMREISGFEIENQFNRIASGHSRQTKFKFEYTYPCEHNDKPAKINFKVIPNSNPPTNIHVVVGRNSVGKTFLIKNIIKSIYEPNDKKYGRLKSLNEETGYYRSASSKNQTFANIICVSFSPFDNYSDIRELLKLKKKIPFSYVGLNESEKEISSVYNEFTNAFIDSLEKCRNNYKKRELLSNAIDILETDPIFEKSNIKELLSNYEKPLDNNLANKTFSKLSSGHKMIILTVTNLVEKLVEKSFVILDEPENHLHPPLLSAFLQALSYLLIEKNGVALVATHSPVILQEVPKSCIWKITRQGYEVIPSRLSIESYGSNIGLLTREVFGLEVRKSGFQKKIDSEVNAGKSYGQIIEEFNCELGDEAIALLNTLIKIRETE